MVRHAAREYGVHALGVTLSREQASWAQRRIKEEGLDHLAEVRFMDYRHVEETGFDAISSIGLTEHIGVKQYPSYFGFIRDRLRPQGRLLNHCITRHDNRFTETGAFLDRYVFPDAELIGSGRIITEVQNVGLEVQHEENIRVHYAQDPRRVVPQPAWTTGTRASPRSARAPRGCGGSTWRARGWPSSATRSSCTTSWPPRPTRTG